MSIDFTDVIDASLNDQSYVDRWDAANEDEHGRLPGEGPGTPGLVFHGVRELARQERAQMAAIALIREQAPRRRSQRHFPPR